MARALSTRSGYELFDVGQEFRKGVREIPSRDVNELSLALNGLVVQRIATSERMIIEGRLVGLQALGFSDVFKLLCTAPEDVVADRYMARERLGSLVESRDALLERLRRDERILSDTWGVCRRDIFNPELYDKLLDTSLGQPDELILSLVNEGFIE